MEDQLKLNRHDFQVRFLRIVNNLHLQLAYIFAASSPENWVSGTQGIKN